MPASKPFVLFLAADIFVRFKNQSTGIWTPPRKFEVEKFEVKMPYERSEKLSRGRTTFNQPFTSINVPQPNEFSITFAEQTREVFAMSLAGSVADINDSVAPITDHAVTVVLDEWVDIGVRNINPVGLTVENSGGTTTYALGSDYEINPRLGLIKALPGGSIVAGDVVINGNTLATTGSRIIGAQQYSHVMSIQVDGLNQINQKNVYFEAGQATVGAQEARDYLSGQLDSVPLSGRLEIPEGASAPFVMDLYD